MADEKTVATDFQEELAAVARSGKAAAAALDLLRQEIDLATETLRKFREMMPIGQWVKELAVSDAAAGRYCGRCDRRGMLGYCGSCDSYFHSDGSEGRGAMQPEGFDTGDVDDLDLDNVPRPDLGPAEGKK